MSLRHALVIGSNCAAPGLNSLEFVRGAAQDLFAVLIDPLTGACDPQESMLLIDPPLTRMASQIKASVGRAASSGASLILSFIGHAVAVEVPHTASQLFLLPVDGAQHPDTDSGYQFGQRLREILGSQDAQGLDGLLVLLDVCSGGIGLLDGAEDFLVLAGSTDTRLELISSVFDLPARGGCFTRTVTMGAGQGLASLSSDFITPSDISDLVSQRCHYQEAPLRLALARGRRVLGDPGLWIAHNRAATGIWPLAESHSGSLAVELTRRYLPTRQIRLVVEAMATSTVTLVTGDAGQGKSALTAALARPEVVPTLLPSGFLSALAFGSLMPTPADLAKHLHSQLATHRSFTAAIAAFEARYQYERELTILSPLQRLVFGPLSCLELSEADTLRIAIDGLDALAPLVQAEISTSIGQLCEAPDLSDSLRFLVTSRTSIPDSLSQVIDQHIEMPAPERDQIREYVRDNLPGAPLGEQEFSIDSWLELVVLAEALEGADLAAVSAARTNNELYSALFNPLLNDADTSVLLAILASAGVGPVMPLSVLYGASRLMNGPMTLPSVVDALVVLGRLVSRSKPGTRDEHVGLSHEALLAWVKSCPPVHTLVLAAHRAVLDVLDQGDPSQAQALAAYRSRAKANHLWALGAHSEAAETVLAICGSSAVDNAFLLDIWVRCATTDLSADHPVTLNLAIERTRWRARSGAVAEARGQVADIVATAESAGAGESREAFRALILEAELEARIGIPAKALEQARLVAERAQVVLGAIDPLTMEARSEEAWCLGQVGEWQAAYDAHSGVLRDRSKFLGPEAADTLRSQGFLAHATAKLGDARRAAEMYATAAEIRSRVLGEDDRDALSYRVNALRWRARAGDSAGAVRECYEVVPLLLDVLGPDDPQTLFAYGVLASSKAADGRLGEALRVLEHIIPRYEKVLGRHSNEALFARINRAGWRSRLDSLESGYEDLIDIVEEISSVLPADNAALLHARGNLAYWTARSGAVEMSRVLYQELLADLVNFRGPEHPQTIHVKRLLAKVGSIRRPDSARRDHEARLADGSIDLRLDSLLPRSARQSLPAVTYDEFALGQVRQVRVTRIVEFGVFVDIQGFRGLIHVSELGWDGQRPKDVVNVGEELTVVVSRLNSESRQVAFSLKQATTDPLLTLAAQHPLGSRVRGVMADSATDGRIAISLPGGVLAQMVRPYPLGADVLEVGDEVEVTIDDVDPRRRRVTVRWDPPISQGRK